VQMCVTTPGPLMSASVTVLPASSMMQGRIFQPTPSIEPALFLSGLAFAPPPFSPRGFSAEMERVSALERSGSAPRLLVNELSGSILSASFWMLGEDGRHRVGMIHRYFDLAHELAFFDFRDAADNLVSRSVFHPNLLSMLMVVIQTRAGIEQKIHRPVI